MPKYQALKDTVHPLDREALKAGATVDLAERAARYAVLKGDLALHAPAVETKPARRSAKTDSKTDSKAG